MVRRNSLAEWMEKIETGYVLPFFQPILSLETMSVYGYESLGRLKDETGNVESLGGFFGLSSAKSGSIDESLDEFSLEIDRKLRKKAIGYLANQSIDPTAKLFLNISPRRLLNHISLYPDLETEVHTLTLAREAGIDPGRIVIEITEEHIEEDIELLWPIIESYKKFGFQIAIDDIGSKSSNLDRIAVLRPDIIKIDMQMLKRSITDRSYEEILFSLSRICENLGISLLFEGVEEKHELEKAIEFGARYVQGYLLDKPFCEFQKLNKYNSTLSNYINEYCIEQYYTIQKRIRLEKIIEDSLSVLNFKEEYWDQLPEIFKLDDSNTFYRFYLTDLLGYQISPNFTRENGSIIRDDTSLGKNWCWRPYFMNHVYASSRNPEEWVISAPYNDLNSKHILKTFSKTIAPNKIFFMDIIHT
ncbi:MAG: EAL domain-containing protein [Leptospiraceae bacterium]|nr:EAL domain-containing protein [Leptospiraceae bacterium]MCP5510345.1 EAL domain-containing protein [Leptospiraceae bacterium]